MTGRTTVGQRLSPSGATHDRRTITLTYDQISWLDRELYRYSVTPENFAHGTQHSQSSKARALTTVISLSSDSKWSVSLRILPFCKQESNNAIDKTHQEGRHHRKIRHAVRIPSPRFPRRWNKMQDRDAMSREIAATSKLRGDEGLGACSDSLI